MGGATVDVWISASSPLLTYTTNSSVTGGWKQTSSGIAECSGSDGCSVGVDSLYFSEFAWIWDSTSSYTVSVGLDGSLQSGSGSSGAATLSSSIGTHSARLEAECDGCGSAEMFALVQGKLTTQLASSGTAVNSTLDDASSEVSYTGWTSTTSSSTSISTISDGDFYSGTLSYTSTSGAAATFSVTGSALYIFGCTGPTFGTFQVTIDSTVIGIYNASTTVNTYSTLLFFASGLSDASHQVKITNQVDGLMLALDYFVAVSTSVDGAATTTTAGTATTRTTALTSTAATAVFSSSSSSGGESGSAGAVAGGIIGALAGLLVLYFAWRYYQYRKAGGEGDCFVALCGPRKKPPQKAGPGKDEFHLWPMLRFRPKYMTH